MSCFLTYFPTVMFKFGLKIESHQKDQSNQNLLTQFSKRKNSGPKIHKGKIPGC